MALFAIVNSSYSQVFKGKLIDELTNEPIIGATVHLKNTEIKSLSDYKGIFILEGNFNENDSIVFINNILDY